MAQTLQLFAPLTDATALPRLLGLALLGGLVVAARLRAGNLWLPIGIHAAFVAAFRVGRLFFVIHPGPAWLVVTGWPPWSAASPGGWPSPSPAVWSSTGVNNQDFP
jgi:hypothetical protein